MLNSQGSNLGHLVTPAWTSSLSNVWGDLGESGKDFVMMLQGLMMVWRTIQLAFDKFQIVFYCVYNQEVYFG